jgi:hypothetical protein
MVTKTLEGHRFIRTTPMNNLSRRKFDPWGAHGIPLTPLNFEHCASGNYLWFSSFVLKDGTGYFYISVTPVPLPPFPGIFFAFTNYVVPFYPGFWQGEAYNYIVRSAAFLKFTRTELDAYEAAN